VQLTKTVLPDLTEDHLREPCLLMGARPTNTSRGCEISPNLPSEVALKPWVSYAIVPAFALANANVPLHGLSLSSLDRIHPIGIIAGLFFSSLAASFSRSARS
jgi:Na+/H+ antiporter NhaA